jgi:formamidopyrimidine-DNA glycosylase
VPELPEVETTRRGIAPALGGKRVVAVHVYDRRLRWPVPAGLEQALEGRALVGVDRRSKYLLFRLAGPRGTDTLLVHLGMTGSLRVYKRAPARKPHDHVDIVFDGKLTLRYRDPRRFGTMLWIAGDAASHPLIATLGVEPFSAAFDADLLHRGTRGRRVAIKLALMDNKLVVGVGNIYANEALFAAGIDPSRAANRIRPDEAQRLHAELKRILEAAIVSSGTTFRDYRTATGERGNFQLELFVYGREGEPCKTCRTRLTGTHVIDGRITVFCHRCQS